MRSRRGAVAWQHSIDLYLSRCLLAMVVLSAFIRLLVGCKDGDQIDSIAVYDNLACVWEVYGHVCADIGLHLSGTPFRHIGVLHQHPRFQAGIKV